LNYQRKRIASWMMRGVTSPAGPPSPLKFLATLNVDRWKFASVRGWPLAPSYRPVKGLRQLTVQLKFGLGAPLIVRAGSNRRFRASKELLKMKPGWLNTLKMSILNSRLAEFHFGILMALVSEMSNW
jgi:hypothetical protein